MKRLTYDFELGGEHCWQVEGADNLECREVCKRQEGNGCKTCPIAKAFDRLAAIEDILGDDYDLDRLAAMCNQRMSMRDEVSERFSLTAKIPVDRLREIVAAERERRAVLERLGEFGQLFIDYVGCPRGAMGRQCAPLTEELLSMPVITDVDGGRWRPVNEDALQEAIALLKERQG